MSLRNSLGWPFFAGKVRRECSSKRRTVSRTRNLRLEPLEERRLLVLNAAAVFPAEVLPGTGYEGVVELHGCTGALLSTGRHILTAAHCVDIDDLPNRRGDKIVNVGPVQDGAERYWPVTFELPGGSTEVLRVTSDKITLHWLPGETDGWDGVHSHGSDIAIMELPELAPTAAKGWEIYTDSQEEGRDFSFVGFGYTNFTDLSGGAMDGSVGADICDQVTPGPAGSDPVGCLANFGLKRFGKNHLDLNSTTRYSGSGNTKFDDNLRFDLDNPGIVGEAGCAPGDSGGPLFIDNLIAGVTSGCSPGFGGNSSYTRVSQFADWIRDKVDDDYDLVINMDHQRSGGDGAPDTIRLTSTKRSGKDVLSVIVNGTTVFEEEHFDRIKSVRLNGSTDNEAVWIESDVGSFWPGGPVTVNGGGGIDTLTVDDSKLVDDPLVSHDVPNLIRLDTSSIDRATGVFPFETPHKVHVNDLDGLTYLAATRAVVYDIQGSPRMGSGQTTIYGSPISNDTFTVHPRDFAGNPTIFGRIGIFGGASLDDKLYIDDSLAGNSGAIWNVENPHGGATQSFSVAGGDTIGAYLDVEKVIVKGSQQDDVFRIESYQNGSSLEVYGLGGADTLSMSPTRHNLSADITRMSYFAFDGGDNNDTFNAFNSANANRWAYRQTGDQLFAQEFDTGYGGMVINLTSVTTLHVLGGTQADQFLVDETPQQATITDFDGGAGDDNYTVRPAAGATNLQNIRSVVRFRSGGSDALLIDDRNDTVGRTYHVSATQVGNEGGDNLFAPFAYVEFLGQFLFLQVLTGQGVDIAHVDPHATTPLEIVAGDPTAVPGDALFLNVADAINPQLNQINSSTGVYTFDNRASVTYAGMEHRQSVVIKPDLDIDGVPDLVEDGAAGGDGNNDGIPDSQQADVASLPSLTGAYVTLVAEPGLLLANVNVVSNPAPASAPAGVTFPLGFFDFRVLDLNPGEATTVTLILPQGMAATSYWKYGKTPDNTTDHWYEFTSDGATGASISQGGRVVTLQFIDGQRGDDALRLDGRIVDPGAPGMSAVCNVPGDTNSDCAVNLTDLNNVRNHFGEVGPGLIGDANDDDRVDLADLNAVRNNFGTAPGAPAAVSTPRPKGGLALAPRAVDTILAERLLSNETLQSNLFGSRSRRLPRRSTIAASQAVMPDDFMFPKAAQAARSERTFDRSALTSRPLGS